MPIEGEVRVYITDPQTKEKIKYNGIQDLEVTIEKPEEAPVVNLRKSPKEMKISLDVPSKSIRTLLESNFNKSTFNGSVNEISKQIIEEVFPRRVVWLDMKFSRIHKKKRINKKWRKKYGYICVVYYE